MVRTSWCPVTMIGFEVRCIKLKKGVFEGRESKQNRFVAITIQLTIVNVSSILREVIQRPAAV